MSKYNPFNPNSVVVPTLFAGRASQVSEICKKLSQLKHAMPASFFLYGERGIGKTALVKLIRYLAASNDPEFDGLNLVTSYYVVEDGQDIGSVLQESLNKLTDKMERSLVEKIGSRLGNLFKNGKFEVGAFGVSVGVDANATQSEMRKEITIKDQTVSILSNLIKEITALEDPERKDGLLIVIDEVHNLKNISASASILRNIVTTLDVETLGRLSFLIVGYKEDMEEFFSVDTSARRTFDVIGLDVMPPQDASEVLKKGFKAANVNFDADILNRNIEAAGGYPHSIQIIGRQLIESDTDNTIDQNDWDEAIFHAANDMRSKEFSSMYSFGKPLTLNDQILVLLTEKNKALSKQELFVAMNRKNIYQNLPLLKKTGAIKENEDKKIVLQSQLFRTAILLDQIIRKRRLSN